MGLEECLPQLAEREIYYLPPYSPEWPWDKFDNLRDGVDAAFRQYPAVGVEFSPHCIPNRRG